MHVKAPSSISPRCHFVSTSPYNSGQQWYPNLGATNHVTNDLSNIPTDVDYTCTG
ncbi:hypothetical protein V6Z12_D04G059500 [Gossypium hirsutum]